MNDPITESAKATQEVAKTTGKAIDALQAIAVNGAVSPYLEVGSMVQDEGTHRPCPLRNNNVDAH